jgi:hypothetical protein
MSPLYDYMPGDDIWPGTMSVDPAVISESIAHLDEALALTQRVKVLGALLEGNGPRMVPKPFQLQK